MQSSQTAPQWGSIKAQRLSFHPLDLLLSSTQKKEGAHCRVLLWCSALAHRKYLLPPVLLAGSALERWSPQRFSHCFWAEESIDDHSPVLSSRLATETTTTVPLQIWKFLPTLPTRETLRSFTSFLWSQSWVSWACAPQVLTDNLERNAPLTQTAPQSKAYFCSSKSKKNELVCIFDLPYWCLEKHRKKYLEKKKRGFICDPAWGGAWAVVGMWHFLQELLLHKRHCCYVNGATVE